MPSAAQQDGRDVAVQGATAPPRDQLDRLVRIAEAKVRPPVSGFDDQHIGSGHEGLDATGLPELDIARVEDRCAVVLKVQLRRAEHVARRMQGDHPVAPPHRFTEAEHPPSARSPGVGDQRQRLRRQQRLLVTPGMVGMSVRDEGEAAHDQRVEPKPMPGQRHAVIPDHLACHSGIRSPLANKSAGTSTPIAAYASLGTPMSATRTRPASFKSPGLGSPRVMVTFASTVGE